MTEGGERRASRAFAVLAVGIGGGLAVLAWMGHAYYALPAGERPLHPDHALLRPSGRWGLLFAAIGTGLLFLNLSYLARKRIGRLRDAGRLRTWMDFHVLTGLVGPGLIVLHSALAPRSALGILSFASLLVVVATGIVGRFIYARVPRSLEGRELEIEEVRRSLAAHREELAELGVEGRMLDSLPVDRGDLAAVPPGVLASLARLFRGDARMRREHRAIREAVLASPALRPRAGRILPLVERLVRERLWLARYRELRGLMGSWRFFHRWLALVLLVVIFFHIAIAWTFGDLWILGGTP
jgi:hypothetical protein